MKIDFSNLVLPTEKKPVIALKKKDYILLVPGDARAAENIASTGISQEFERKISSVLKDKYGIHEKK